MNTFINKVRIGENKFLTICFLFFVVGYSGLNAQVLYDKNLDWQIFLDDSLILTGSHDVNYHSRQIATIDIDNGDIFKQFKIVFRSPAVTEKIVDFMEKDSIVFGVSYHSDHGLKDTIIINPKHYYLGLRKLKGKTVGVDHSDNKFQTTPTLLGTLIVKKD